MINKIIFRYRRFSKKYLRKLIFPTLLDFFYLFCIWLKGPVSTKKKYYFSVCAIFKNEELSLKEWLEYHLIVGVEHFYLYNNFSNDTYQNILQPYIEKGIVDLIDWPVKQGQISAYEDFWKKYHQQTQWVAFIDIDEFFCPIHERSVANWLKKYEKYPSVFVYWKMFGTSGKINHNPLQLITEQYTICWANLYAGKVILNTNWEIYNISVHISYAKISLLGRTIKIPPVNEFAKFLIQFNDELPNNRIPKSGFTMQLNHYWSKAYKCYEDKHKKGAVYFEDNPYSMDYFYWHERFNCSSDYNIFRFMIELKLAMQQELCDMNNKDTKMITLS